MNDNTPEPEPPQAPVEESTDAPLPAVVAEPVRSAEPSAPVEAVATPVPEPAPIVVMRPRSHAWWAIAATLICMTAAGSFLAWHFLPSARVAQQDATEAATTVYNDLRDGLEQAAQTMTQAATPTAEIRTLVETAVGELASRGKLVVLTRTLPVRVEKRSTQKILWDQFDLEDSIVRLRVNNNSVQYVLPLDGLSTANFQHDAALNKLTVSLPEPRLDRDMVAVSSNPEDWEVESDISWTRLQDWWGQELLDEARSNVRGLLVEAGQEPLILKEAREQGYVQMTALLKSILAPFAPTLQVEVRFDPTLAPQPGIETWPDNAPLS